MKPTPMIVQTPNPTPTQRRRCCAVTLFVSAMRQTAKIRTPRLPLKKPKTPKRMPNKLATTLNNSNASPKRIPTAIAPLPIHPMRSFSKPFMIAKNFAPASCNNST